MWLVLIYGLGVFQALQFSLFVVLPYFFSPFQGPKFFVIKQAAQFNRVPIVVILLLVTNVYLCLPHIQHII